MITSGKKLAAMLGVSPPALSQAAKKGHFCQGHDISTWAIRSPSGRVDGYDVPRHVWERIGPSPSREKPQETRKRSNPYPTSSNGRSEDHAPQEAREMPEAPERSDDQNETPRHEAESVTQSGEGLSGGVESLNGPAVNSLAGYEGTSVLPPDQDYFRPVSAASTGMVLKTAIQEDNQTARAMVLVGASGIGAATGYGVSGESTAGAVVGFGLAAAAAAWGLGLFNQQRPRNEQPSAAPCPASETRRALAGEQLPQRSRSRSAPLPSLRKRPRNRPVSAGLV